MSEEQISFGDLLRAKKGNNPLTEEQIQWWIQGVTNKTIPEYQTTSLLMLIFWKGMNIQERSYLTKAMARSGQAMDYSQYKAMKVDKHSSGGIGDKTSFIIASLYACEGLLNPMIAGRGLGHSGGTIDKLEAIPGYNVNLNFDEMQESIKNIGAFISGQTEQLAPADKVIYALRDVTETVDEISLITGSILSKKLSEDLGGLTLDIKCGLGAFMQNFEQAAGLAYSLIQTANTAGVITQGVVTRMDFPLGEWSGNSCEVWECVDAMTPGSIYCEMLDRIKYDAKAHGFVTINGNNQLTDIRELLVFITIALTLNTLVIAGNEPEPALNRLKEYWKSGKALDKFKQIVKQQGGDFEAYLKNNQQILDAFKSTENNANIFEYKAPVDGKIERVDGKALGNFLVDLGAGRKVKTDKIIQNVSLQWLVHPNQEVKKGQVIARVYHPDVEHLKRVGAQEKLDNVVTFTENASFQDQIPLIYAVITKDTTEEQLSQMYKQ